MTKAKILDGKAVSQRIKDELRSEVENLSAKGINPGLAVIIVGNNPASRVYVNSKRKDCEECGFLSEEFALPEETTEAELIALIQELNGRDDIDGILCQLPLPKGLDDSLVIAAIDPKKDVDAFHAENVGHIMIGDQVFTDMWCGHRAGLLCIMPAPICDRDQIQTKVKRGLERQVMKTYFKKYGK